MDFQTNPSIRPVDESKIVNKTFQIMFFLSDHGCSEKHCKFFILLKYFQSAGVDDSGSSQWVTGRFLPVQDTKAVAYTGRVQKI